ncbi:hypothetical protein SPI_02795 [Niveomyces insectorum RCEF 264]|uniref:AB hydrolase-1 domain-containing protein n=1 Tax=Niveomyces insectorum RCEF 264 TaxID=1081102 RepID=A0A162KCC8_9HYPO|nr:hypothetical protein SPI_02795 [Niveomyces insectorum RCEF 264]
MRRTLLLCFVHGFKGGADTFGVRSRFALDLRQRVAAALPRVDVRLAMYPPYDTRGDLAACVARFVDWLLEQVIDLEVAARTPSPTVDPSVRCVLIGHSMGGIVAADALLALAGDPRVGRGPNNDRDAEGAEGNDNDNDNDKAKHTPLNAFMFPYVQGVLGLDTPYLGIAPGVVAHGAEEQYTAASAALAQPSSSVRTFCNLPDDDDAAAGVGEWRPAGNDAATDETGAHVRMFEPATNPNYDQLVADACSMVARWTQGTAWYAGSASDGAVAQAG